MDKPTTLTKIVYIRERRIGLENKLAVAKIMKYPSPMAVGLLEREIEILRAIEEDLNAIRLWEAARKDNISFREEVVNG